MPTLRHTADFRYVIYARYGVRDATLPVISQLRHAAADAITPLFYFHYFLRYAITFDAAAFAMLIDARLRHYFFFSPSMRHLMLFLMLSPLYAMLFFFLIFAALVYLRAAAAVCFFAAVIDAEMPPLFSGYTALLLCAAYVYAAFFFLDAAAIDALLPCQRYYAIIFALFDLLRHSSCLLSP